MSSVITDRFEQFDLSSIPKKAQTELRLRQQSIQRRVGKAYREVVRQQEQVIGSLRDAPRERVYSVAHRVFKTAAKTLQRGPSPLRQGAERLSEAASYFESEIQQLIAPPIERYDELNVKQVCKEMRDLDAHSLLKVEAYERANKNRVTVLREVERLLTR